MNIVLKTGFASITQNIDFAEKTIEKGKKLAFCHVLDVQESKTMNKSVITCTCVRQTTVSQKAYTVTLTVSHCNSLDILFLIEILLFFINFYNYYLFNQVNEHRKVIDRSCTCVAKELKACKHIYALIHRINNDRSESKTSFEQLWGKPSPNQLVKEIYAKGMAVSKLFPPKQIAGDVSAYIPTSEDFKNIRCPLSPIMVEENRTAEERSRIAVERENAKKQQEEIENQSIEACAISLINMSTELISSSLKYDTSVNFASKEAKDFYEKNVQLNESDIIKLCIETKNQSDSKRWHEVRRLRITASSKAHKIKTLKTKTPESLASDFLSTPQIQHKNLAYGTMNEKNALRDYQLWYEADEVYCIGTFVSPLFPWISVSVDAIVVKEGQVEKLVEIKCPISCKSKPIYDTKEEKFNVRYLKMVNGDVQLVVTYEYYTQCQLQMFVTGTTVCDLFVWSPFDRVKVEVHYDDIFMINLFPRLKEFYFSYYLKALCKENQENA